MRPAIRTITRAIDRAERTRDAMHQELRALAAAGRFPMPEPDAARLWARFWAAEDALKAAWAAWRAHAKHPSGFGAGFASDRALAARKGRA